MIKTTFIFFGLVSSAILPLDQDLTRLRGFSGRWANEFQIEDIAVFTGSYVRESKAGRTSHDSFPGLIAAQAQTNENSGACYGYHLGWSGNHRVRVDRLADGRAQLGLLAARRLLVERLKVVVEQMARGGGGDERVVALGGAVR